LLLREWKDIGLRSVVIGFEEIDDARLDGMVKTSAPPSTARPSADSTKSA
jgi:hypothetical protein